jgi:hypothetical protein
MTNTLNEKIHPIYDLLTIDIKQLIRGIAKGDLRYSIIYLYGQCSNGKKTLINLFKKIFKVIEITDNLTLDHYHQGYLDGKLDTLKKMCDYEPNLFVNTTSEIDYLYYYASYTFQNWLRNYSAPVIITTNIIPDFSTYPTINTLNIKVIKMRCIFTSENDPESAEWKSFITMDSSIQIKPVLPYNHVINKEAENIVKTL